MMEFLYQPPPSTLRVAIHSDDIKAVIQRFEPISVHPGAPRRCLATLLVRGDRANKFVEVETFEPYDDVLRRLADARRPQA